MTTFFQTISLVTPFNKQHLLFSLLCLFVVTDVFPCDKMKKHIKSIPNINFIAPATG